MQEWIDAIRNNTLLQAIAILVALLTAGYYFLKILLVLGKNVWAKTSPRLINRIDKVLVTQATKQKLASTDTNFLISYTGWRFCIFIWFLIMYFLTFVDTANGASGKWYTWTILARIVFQLAWIWNFVTLSAFLRDVARDRLKNAVNND